MKENFLFFLNFFGRNDLTENSSKTAAAPSNEAGGSSSIESTVKQPSATSKEEEDDDMSGRPRTTSFAEGNKQQPQNLVLGGMKVSSEYLFTF